MATKTKISVETLVAVSGSVYKRLPQVCGKQSPAAVLAGWKKAETEALRAHPEFAELPVEWHLSAAEVKAAVKPAAPTK